MFAIRSLGIALGTSLVVLFAAPPMPSLAGPDDLRSFEIVPIAPTNPPIKDRLFFDASVRRDGNAAVGYMRAMVFMRRELEDQVDKAVDSLTADDAHFLPLAEPIYNDSNTLTDMMDIGAHRSDADWDEGIADRGYLALLPELNHTRALANMLRIRSEFQIRRGNLNDAISNIRQSFELSHQLGRYHVLIGGLVANGICKLSIDSLTEIMDRPDAPNLYWSLAALPVPFINMDRSMNAEQVEMMALLPSLKEATTKQLSDAQWRSVLWQLLQVTKNLQSAPAAKTSATAPADLDLQLNSALGIARILPTAHKWYADTHKLSPDKAADADPISVVAEYYLDQYQTLHKERDEILKLPYPTMLPRAHQWTREFDDMKRRQPNNLFLQTSGSFDRIAEIYARLDRELAALTTVEALRSNAAAHDGKFPARLEDMTDTPAPVNPRSGTPFGYGVNGDTAKLSDPQPSGDPLDYTIKIRSIDSPAGL